MPGYQGGKDELDPTPSGAICWLGAPEQWLGHPEPQLLIDKLGTDNAWVTGICEDSMTPCTLSAGPRAL